MSRKALPFHRKHQLGVDDVHIDATTKIESKELKATTNRQDNTWSRNSSFHHSFLLKEEAFIKVESIAMYDNARQKLTLTIIIFLMLISCFAGDTWMIWVSGFI